MTEFNGDDLRGSRFDRVDLTGARFFASELSEVEIRGCDMNKVVMRGVELSEVEISGEIRGLTVNGVDVGPLVEAELNRRYPERARMRPTDPAGFREAWDILERLWAGTVERAARLDPELLHESVDGEWSFIETLRHLSFATDSWIRRGLLGVPAPWDPLGLPWGEAQENPAFPRDLTARPSLETALELRRSRTATVRAYMDSLAEERLAASTEPLKGPGWPPEGATFPVRECLLVVLNEEWEHRLYAERDLAILEARRQHRSAR